MKILIAEDNPSDRKLLQAQLETAGHSVLAAADGCDALALLRRESVDAVISDILMPRMDGYRLCFEVRKDEQLRHLPFIFRTNVFDSSSDEALARELAADQLIKKSASPEVILEALQNARGPGRCPIADAARQPGEKDLLKECSGRLASKLAERSLELSQANEKLRATKTQMRQLLDHSPVIIYALTVDGQKVFPQLVSESLTRLLGFTVAEALNGAWWERKLHPEDRDEAIASLSETLTCGTSRTEYRLRDKTGGYHWVEDIRRVIYDPLNQPAEIAGVWTGITERKRTEESLRESEEKFCQLADNISDVFWITSPDLATIHYVSPGYELIWGRSTESL